MNVIKQLKVESLSMKVKILSFFTGFLFLSVLARPQDEEKIDLSRLGSQLYGNPVPNNGTIVMDPKKNPEEFGPYLEGDLLIPVKLQRNGMKNEAMRWKNGEVPYVIRGRYSKLEISKIQI